MGQVPAEPAANFPPGEPTAYHCTVPKKPRPTAGRERPGLAKAGRLSLVLKRQLAVWHASDYGWRELFESADVVSEGAVVQDAQGATYFGTTSVLLPFASRGGLVPDAIGAIAGQLAARDPHARVRAMRIACREAQVRAGQPLERISAEVVVRSDRRGIRVDVELCARVRSARGQTPRRKASDVPR